LEAHDSNEARLCDICGERPGSVEVIYTGGLGQRGGALCHQCAHEAMAVHQGGGAFGPFGPGGPGAGAGRRGGSATAERQQTRQRSDTPALDEFGRDLTADARSGRIDPLVGRDQEIEQTIEILARRRKNNAVLIGEPGVGKTAIAEGLASRIASGDVPEPLRGKRLVSLDLGGMLAGAQFRGQFEQRLKSVLEEVSSSDGRVLLFLDELHTVLGTGAAEGAMDAANLLKPMLARGELRMIGATTLDEYRRIERDGALARRFSPVTVDEPSVEDTVVILRGLRKTYEEHHGCSVSDEALEAAARLSDRYITDQQLPDKAIDLIDQAGARLRLRRSGDDEIAQLRERLEKARDEKAESVRAEDYERAGWLKNRIDEYEAELAAFDASAAEAGDGSAASAQAASNTVGEADIAALIASRTGIPVGQLVESELSRLASLESDLHSRVVGQEQAVELVADTVRRAHAGLSEPDQPLGSFLFLGPTGVGKTELVKALSERLFASEKALVRIDMSEFREPHTVARLIGSPPGYVGYGEGGQLTEPVRRRPYSVVLLDEIEKAHPEVWNILLQVLDDGRLTDGEGRTVDFTNTVIVMTSNLGAGKAKRGVGFTASDAGSSGDSEQMLEAVKRAFLPEFLNRIDETVAFKALTEAQVEEICAMVVDRVAARMAEEHGVTLEASPELIARLAADGFDAEFGARPLKRHVRRTLEKELTRVVIGGSVSDGAVIRADVDDEGRVALDVSSPAAVAA
jgi:ATP-dependent Clp protease ATP-binding subunit ClpC